MLAAGAVLSTLGGTRAGIAGANATPVRAASAQVSQSFEIPVTNPADGVSIPSLVLADSATLSNELPAGSHVRAPKGDLFLSLTMSSRPVQRSYGDHLWGRFFSEMAPLPGSAITFATGNGTAFTATRISPVPPDSTSTSTADGLVAATYYFTVPDSIRSGTVGIGPSQTTGVEYTGFVGGDPTNLQIGGPASFSISFPAKLTVVTPPSSTTTPTGGAQPTSNSGTGVRMVLTGILVAGGIGLVVVLVRRRRGDPTRDDEVSPEPDEPDGADEVEVPAAVVTEEDVANSSGLRINVLGAIEFDPALPGISDPARSLLCYLAFHRDRPMTRGEIQTALWPTTSTTKDVTPATFRNYVSEARKSVGSDVLPDASRGADYRLVGISTDLDEFRELSRSARELDDTASIERRQHALRLVREAPFAGEVSTFFEWVHFEGLSSQISREVSDVAYRAVLDCRRVGDLEGAEHAAQIGLLVAPAMMQLWEELVEITLERHGAHGLDGLWPQAEAQLSAEGVEELHRRAGG